MWRRLVTVKMVVLVEYVLVVAGIAAAVLVEVATYRRPSHRADTCFEPQLSMIVGVLAVSVLFVAATGALGLATAWGRRRTRRGLGPMLGTGPVLVVGTTLAVAGLIVAVLLIVSVFVVADLIH
jgi:hypothetical protein